MSRLREYGGRIIKINERRVVEMRDPNDNAKHRYQYCVMDGALHKRLLSSGGEIIDNWTAYTDAEVCALQAVRAGYHPILDELGL